MLKSISLPEKKFTDDDGSGHKPVPNNSEVIEAINRKLLQCEAEKKELEKKLESKTLKLERKIIELESLFQNSSMGILVADSEGRIVRVNPSAEKKFQYSESQLSGKKVEVLIPKCPAIKEKHNHNSSLAENDVKMDLYAVKKNGMQFPVEVSLSPFTTSKGRFIIVFVVDASARRENEAIINEKTKALERGHQILKAKNTTLEKLNKELETFTFISSHDLQEPLRKIRNFVNILLKKESRQLSADGKKFLQKTSETAYRMQMLIEDLLVYTRVRNADRKLERKNLDKVMMEVINEFSELIESKKAIVKLNKLCKATIIPFQFRQLMHNLIGNALKFAHPGRQPRIVIKSETRLGSKLKNPLLLPKKKYCHIVISDNGMGFDPQYKDRIFEVFERLHPAGKFDGTGIGLAICKRIVENHEGIITAKGIPGKGARFDIFLPDFKRKY